MNAIISYNKVTLCCVTCRNCLCNEASVDSAEAASLVCSVNKPALYLHIIYTDRLRVDSCTVPHPRGSAAQFTPEMLKQRPAALLCTAVSGFYLSILSCRICNSPVRLCVLLSLMLISSLLPPLSLSVSPDSLNLSCFHIHPCPALFIPSHSLKALISVSPHLFICLSCRTLPALFCSPAPPLYHHHHHRVHAA